MKSSFKLYPRFHYSFRIIDFLYSIKSSLIYKNYLLKYFNTNEIYHLNFARSSLYLLLKVISNGQELKIGVQPYLCETVFSAIKRAGCIPVFIDINQIFSIDNMDLGAKIDEIDGLIVTHTFGIPANFNEIKPIMKGKFIIEDCAHAFLSEFENQPCGTLGDASIFSMGYGKFPSIGIGGFAIINNRKIQIDFKARFDKLPEPSFLVETRGMINNYLYTFAFKPFVYGLLTYPIFKKLDKKYDFIKKTLFTITKGLNANRNVFYNNIKRYQKINANRIKKSIQFLSMLENKPEYISNTGNNYYLIPLLFPNRAMLYSFLLSKGFECGKHFSKSIEIAEQYGYIKGSCPNSEKIASEILVMPNIVNLSTTQMKFITNVLNNSISL